MDGIFVDSLRNGEVQTQPNVLAMLRSQDENARQTMELSFRIVRLERPFSTVWVARCDGQIDGAANIAVWPDCQLPPGEMLKLMPQLSGRNWWHIFRGMQLQTAWKRHWHICPKCYLQSFPP